MFLKILYLLTVVLILFLLLLLLTIFVFRIWLRRRKLKLDGELNKVICVGIFHPYCNAGGGGERVLWCAVRALQEKYDNIKIIIYTGDIDCSPCSILNKAKTIFNVNVDESNINFVYLRRRNWIEANRYPYLTLLFQSFGSMVLAIEALSLFPPDVFIDTMGFAFTLPLFRFLGSCKVGCYVHYPTISTDMLRRVQQRKNFHNNQNYVARNPFLTWIKLTYYRIFAKIYSLVGRCSETVMVNSSWTENHILELWDVPFKTHRVYPPCNVSHIKDISQGGKKYDIDEIIIISVGQFRPEKDHPLQLQTMYELRTLLTHDEHLWNKVRLFIVGSCRNEEDYERLKNMQDLTKHLSLENSVEFKVNIPFQDLLKLYKVSQIGIHTMWNEHFGIGIVECMAAGIIMIANRSGGPALDIIETSEGSQNGYLAGDAIEYAKCIMRIIISSEEENGVVRRAAISSVDRFSEKEFEVNFLRAVSPLFNETPQNIQ